MISAQDTKSTCHKEKNRHNGKINATYYVHTHTHTHICFQSFKRKKCGALCWKKVVNVLRLYFQATKFKENLF